MHLYTKEIDFTHAAGGAGRKSMYSTLPLCCPLDLKSEEIRIVHSWLAVGTRGARPDRCKEASQGPTVRPESVVWRQDYVTLRKCKPQRLTENILTVKKDTDYRHLVQRSWGEVVNFTLEVDTTRIHDVFQKVPPEFPDSGTTAEVKRSVVNGFSGVFMLFISN